MPCLGVKIQQQLSEYPSFTEEMLHYLMFIFLMVIRSHTLQMLLFLKTASTILLLLCYYVLTILHSELCYQLFSCNFYFYFSSTQNFKFQTFF